MANQKRKITNTLVEEINPGPKETVIWDTQVAGFGLRIRPTGGKSYVFTYRSAGGRAGTVKRVTIGDATKVKADVARDEAKRLAALHFGGIDTAQERAEDKAAAKKQKDAPTVASLLDRFMRDHAKPTLKEKTWQEYERLIEKVLKPEIGEVKVRDLLTVHVSEMHHRLRDKPTQAALAVRVLSSAMGKAIEWNLREAGSNPTKIRLKGSRRRERLFSDAEVVRLQAAITKLEATGNIIPPVALGLRLLFETGCRAGEICDLTWSHVDLDEGILAWRDSKTGYLEKVITKEASILLDKAARVEGVAYVCPSTIGKRLRVETLEGGFERVMKEARVPANENASLHLIRHWFATKTYSDASIALPIAMKMVGHKSVATAMRYAHAAREDVKKATLKAEKSRAAALKLAQKSGKVIPLKAAK